MLNKFCTVVSSLGSELVMCSEMLLLKISYFLTWSLSAVRCCYLIYSVTSLQRENKSVTIKPDVFSKES